MQKSEKRTKISLEMERLHNFMIIAETGRGYDKLSDTDKKKVDEIRETNRMIKKMFTVTQEDLNKRFTI
jgi:hypothetical protein